LNNNDLYAFVTPSFKIYPRSIRLLHMTNLGLILNKVYVILVVH